MLENYRRKFWEGRRFFFLQVHVWLSREGTGRPTFLPRKYLPQTSSLPPPGMSRFHPVSSL
jgi:hypothetical protein